MSSPVVHVQNISSQTSEKEIRDFFSFCGKITNLSVTPASGESNSTQTATVTFEKDTAAKTALLLDNTQLGSSQVQVSAGQNIEQVAASAGAHTTSPTQGEEEISQDDKPRARIFAEYLAHGYMLSDTAIQRAIQLDNQHGVSNRFTSALQTFDQKFKASERAQQLDKQYGLSGRAQTGFNTLHSYFESAIGTPTGQRLAAFYTEGEKQVRDVHAEARRLADLKSGKHNVAHSVPGTDKTVCSCQGNDGNCPCPEGKCHCVGCGKSGIVASSTNQAHPVAGSDHTVCNCGGTTTNCACAEGKCSCAGCAKNTTGSEKTVCNCAGNSGSCPCAPGQCGCAGCSKHSGAGETAASGTT